MMQQPVFGMAAMSMSVWPIGRLARCKVGGKSGTCRISPAETNCSSGRLLKQLQGRHVLLDDAEVGIAGEADRGHAVSQKVGSEDSTHPTLGAAAAPAGK